MRLSRLFARTLRNAPADAEAPSHKLLLRAAYIRQLMAGVYTTLPLGLRTMNKIEEIVREEMLAAGAQEIRMPITLPADSWRATGRYEAYGETLFKLADRHGREMVLGPTQEEVAAPLVAAELQSYRDLPVNLFQIEWKYRDEFRPRFGLLRGREFLMKDAYSFDRDEEGMQASYDVMFEAYKRIFDRCGLDYVIVEADPGQIGGGTNHEFMALSDIGEDLFVECENGDYLADTEAATPRTPQPVITPAGNLAPLEKVHTPGASSIEDVSKALGTAPETMLKCMMFDAGGETLAVLVPGNREVNESKLHRMYFPTVVRKFEEQDFEGRGFVKGFVGPQGLPHGVTVLADHSVRAGANWSAGANEPDYHVVGANVDRDFRVDSYEDLIAIADGDVCPNDGGSLHIGRSIVVGHIYQLGTKYSKPLGTTYVEEDGTDNFFEMGCYGIGISRIMAAAVEQNNDELGLKWPKALAPFDVVIIMANRDHEKVVSEAERLHMELEGVGLSAALDDREVAAGVKFNDADLVGYPVQVVVGKRGVESGEVDLKLRATGQKTQAPLAEAASAAVELLGSAP